MSRTPAVRRLAAALFVALALAPAAHAASVPSSSTLVTDGPVHAEALDSSGRLYLGGEFGQVGPRMGSGLAWSTSSDSPAAGFPDVNGSVYASAPDGAGGEFIGGNFTSVGGVTRNRLAHIRADRTVDPSWDPGAKSTVRAIALSSDGASLFVGGDFTGTGAIGGVARSRLAKLSTASGVVDPDWLPPATTNSVHAIVASPSAVYVGGQFNPLEFGTSPHLAKLSPTGSGSVDPTWNPAIVGTNVRALALSGSDLYVGGVFSSVGGQTRQNLAKVQSGGTGAVDTGFDWGAGPPTETRALQVSGGDLFVGGLGFVVKTAASTGAIDVTWATGFVGDVNALGISGGNLVVGGGFFITGPHQNLALLSTTGTGAALSWNPNPNRLVRTVLPTGSDVFAGGDFSSAGPLSAYTGGLVRLKPDGTLDAAWKPYLQGAVKALALDGSDLYVGGNFYRTGLGNSLTGPLARIPIGGSGAIDPTWSPMADADIRALAVSATDVFVGGDFAGPTSIGGQPRVDLAKVPKAGNGSADATWNPDIGGGAVTALALTGNDLIVGGSFGGVNALSRAGLAKLATSGAGDPDPTWDPKQAGGDVAVLLVSGSNVFVGGTFSGTIGGQSRSRLAQLSTSGAGGATAWNPNANTSVLALALNGDNLHIGGGFTTVNGQPRNRMAIVSASTGTLDGSFDPPTSTNAGAVNALVATPSRIFAGGDFSNVGSYSTAGFAMFDLTPPTIDLSSPADGARLRQGQVVNAAYSCQDSDGILDTLTCTGNVPSGSAIDTAAAGAKTFTVSVTDIGNNTASKSVGYTVDGSAPEIAIATPADGATYVAGSQVNVAYSCSDADGATDVASCAGGVPTGTPLDTSTAGPHTFTVTAADAVGNASSRTVSYEVTKTPTRPIISTLRITPAFRAAPRGATTSARRKKKAPVGGKVTYKLSQAASVTFKVTRRSGKRAITVGTFKLKGKAGANRFTFRGRLKKKALKIGKYQLVAQATAPTGLKSVTAKAAFKIVKR